MPVAQSLLGSSRSPLTRSTPAGPHQWRACDGGHVAQSVRRPLSPFSLSGDVPPGECRGRLAQRGAAFGSPVGIRFPVLGPVAELRRKTNRGARPHWRTVIGDVSARKVERGGAEGQPSLLKRPRCSAGSPRCSCAPSEREDTAWQMTEAARPKRRCDQECRAPRSASRTRGPVRRRDNRGGTVNVARGQTGSPRSV